jgi:hypothetical protein
VIVSPKISIHLKDHDRLGAICKRPKFLKLHERAQNDVVGWEQEYTLPYTRGDCEMRRFVDPGERLHGRSDEGPGVTPIRRGTATAGSGATALFLRVQGVRERNEIDGCDDT